jgi:hypothetical protein
MRSAENSHLTRPWLVWYKPAHVRSRVVGNLHTPVVYTKAVRSAMHRSQPHPAGSSYGYVDIPRHGNVGKVRSPADHRGRRG